MRLFYAVIGLISGVTKNEVTDQRAVTINQPF